MHQLRRLRARMSERGDFSGRGNLRNRPEQMHRMRRPFQRATVRAGVPGGVHSGRSAAGGEPENALGAVSGVAGGDTGGTAERLVQVVRL